MIVVEIEITKENLKLFLNREDNIEKYRLCYTVRVNNSLEYVSNEIAVDGVILKINISKKELELLYSLIELMREEKILSEAENNVVYRKHRVEKAERNFKLLVEGGEHNK